MKIHQLKAGALISVATLIFVSLLFTGVLHFEVWSQIDYLSNAEVDTTSASLMAQLPRYFVVSPAYLLSDELGVNLDAVYSWYMLGVTVMTSILWAISRDMLFKSSAKFSFVYSVPFILLFGVNGRFVFGLFGLSLLLSLSISLANSGLTVAKTIGMFFGLLFSSVSSGVFMVGFLFLLMSFIDKNNKDNPRVKNGTKKGAVWLVLILIVLPAFALTGAFLFKNFTYFMDEGSLLNILSHGLGVFFNPEYQLGQCLTYNDSGLICRYVAVVSLVGMMLPTVLLLSMILLGAIVISKLNFPNLAIRGLILSALGGVFGFTTLMSFIFVLPICVNRKYLSRDEKRSSTL